VAHPPGPNAADGWQARLRRAAAAAREACLQVFGIPDYRRYVAHAQAHHPGQPLLSEREFHVRAIDRKYAGKGPRCC